MSSFDRDAYLRRNCPTHSDRALALRDRIQKMGYICDASPEFDDDEPVDEACLSIWNGQQVLGCASINNDGMSFYLEGFGGRDEANDEDIIAALTHIQNHRSD